MHRLLAMTLLTLFLACDADPVAEAHIKASDELTERYRQFPKWSIRSYAAGNDCQVLLVQTGQALTDNIVEAFQYGSPKYKVYEGGIQKFAADRRFRAVTYRDVNERLWTYGATTEKEARSLEPCGSWP
ncbi:MAG TPA: hypothetical protein VF787_01365 [Thermoanaerobaculia bacterium]